MVCRKGHKSSHLIPNSAFSLKMSGVLRASFCTYSYVKSAKQVYILALKHLAAKHTACCCCCCFTHESFVYLCPPSSGQSLLCICHWRASPPRWSLGHFRFPPRQKSPRFHRTSSGRWSAAIKKRRRKKRQHRDLCKRKIQWRVRWGLIVVSFISMHSNTSIIIVLLSCYIS